MKIKIPKKITEYFSSYKNKFNPQTNSWDSIQSSIIGHLWWKKNDTQKTN
jgi:hypothetical protein